MDRRLNGSGSPLIFSACAQGILEEVNLLQEITEAARACVRAFVEDRTDASGLVSTDSFASFARGMGLQAQPWEAALKVPRTSATITELDHCCLYLGAWQVSGCTDLANVPELLT